MKKNADKTKFSIQGKKSEDQFTIGKREKQTKKRIFKIQENPISFVVDWQIE